MRILVTNWMDPENPHAGGAEVHLVEVFARLVEQGHQVTLISAGWSGGASRARVRGIEVIRVGNRWTFALAGPAAVRHALRENRFDVMVEDLNKLPLATPRWSSVPVVVVVHHLWGLAAFRATWAPVAWLTWAGERSLARGYRHSRFIAVSESTRNELIKRNISPARVSVVFNGVERPPDSIGLTHRAGEPTLLYLGRLQGYKRVHRLLDAAARLLKERHSIRVVVAGTGPCRGRLERRAKALGLREVATFPGRVDEATKWTLFREAWVNVVPSVIEGWGLTVLEAAMVGTASVVANVPGLRDSVRHFETGLVAPQGEMLDLTAAIRYLLLNPGEVERLGSAARVWAETLTWDRAAAATEAVLNEACYQLADPARSPLDVPDRNLLGLPLPRKP